MNSHAGDTYCRGIIKLIGTPGCNFTYNISRIVIQKILVDSKIKFVSRSKLRQSVPHSAHHPTLGGHPQERRMCNWPKTTYYWLYKTLDICNGMKEYQRRPRKETKIKHERRLKLFPPSGSLELMAMALWKLLLQTRKGNQLVIVMTNLYFNLKRAVPWTWITATKVGNVFRNFFM